MPSRKTSTTNTTRSKGWGVPLAVGGTALALGGVVGWALLQPAKPHLASTRCTDRVAVIDGSSSRHSEAAAALEAQLLKDAAVSSMVCGTSLVALAVNGGGTAEVVLTAADLPVIEGGSADLRRGRLTAGHIAAVEIAVHDAVLRAHAQNSTTTSVAAFFNAAADVATPEAEVIIITDGVNSDDVADLNRPLLNGEGVELAALMNPRQLDAERVVMVGIGQVAQSSPPPGARWSEEVRAFNEAVCAAAASSAACDVLAVADPGTVLT